MLSGLETLLGVPQAEIVGDLPLADTVREAVLDRTGPLGEVLTAALRIAEGSGAATEAEADALRDALVWADGQLPPREV